MEIKVDANSDDTNKIVVAYLNEDVLSNGYSKLSDEGLQVSNYTSTKVEGTIDVKADGTFLTSIPYEKGWTLYVDGQKTDTKEVMGVFLAADLTKGTHDIKFVYSPEGFVAGSILGTIGLFAFILLCVLDFRKSLKKKS